MNIVQIIRDGEPREAFAGRIHVSPKTVQRKEADPLPDLRFVAHVIKTTGAEWAIPVCLKQVEVALENMIGKRERHQLRTDA